MLSTPWTRLIRFIAHEDGKPYFGEPVDPKLDIGLAYRDGKPIYARILLGDPLAADAQGRATAQLSADQKSVKKLLSPLSREQIQTVRALGANYPSAGAAIAEARKGRPKIPILFYKPPTCIAGPSDPVVVPHEARKDGDQTDYEVELVVVIGRPCRDVSPREALSYVMAYTLSNDVSARKLMFAVPQWGLGKSFDGWLPIGPCLVSASAPGGISNPDADNGAVRLTTHVNGKEMQNGLTSNMLFTCAETISALSAGTTLEPGSIISMGTPPGEGFKRKPEVWLHHGDICNVAGSHGLGTLINPIVEEAAPPRAKL